MTVGATTGEDELESIIAQGGRRGEIYAKLRDIRDQYADLIRAQYPEYSPARLRLQPRSTSAGKRISTWRERWSARKAPA